MINTALTLITLLALWLMKSKLINLEYQVNKLEYVVRRLNGEKIERINGITIITQDNYMEP